MKFTSIINQNRARYIAMTGRATQKKIVANRRTSTVFSKNVRYYLQRIIAHFNNI